MQRLVAFLALTVPADGIAFRSKADLRAAVVAWEINTERSRIASEHGQISDWDVSQITDMSGLFRDLENFNESIGLWDLSSVTNMSHMFTNAKVFNQPIASWDTSRVTDMTYMFFKAKAFNQPIGSWNTSQVTGMKHMFDTAWAFNQPIGSWNTSGVTDMSRMFTDAKVFNQPIASWDTSRVTDMTYMFFKAKAFNQPIGSWNTEQVTGMKHMFDTAWAFNQPIGSWNTSGVTDMSRMFTDAKVFNQPIASWDTSRVTDMNHIFFKAKAFNQPIGSWNTSRVTDMQNMFDTAWAFNQPIGSWNTSGVTLMKKMFCDAKVFNQPIASWDTSRVTDMSFMFYKAKAFNQPIGSWNTSRVTDMRRMFDTAWAFNQPIGSWNTSGVTDMWKMFISARAFNQTLISWDISNLHHDVGMIRSATAFVHQCPAGQFDAHNGLGCVTCQTGRWAPKDATQCHSCPQNSIPTDDQSGCEDCPSSQFANEGANSCTACSLPFILVDVHCVWWHLPLLLLAFVAFMVAGGLLRRKWIESIFNKMDKDLWSNVPGDIKRHRAKLARLAVLSVEVDRRIAALRKEQSEIAGVSMRYLLSDGFLQLATQRTGKGDPTFMEMKTVFWESADPLGADILCPRDGKPGCALVDWIDRDERREQTHFMSWTWQYRLMQVRSALEMYQASSSPAVVPADVFFFMCFFVNNQHRILLEKSITGSADLENVFERNLKRLGRMVAVLDTWNQPVYLGRVWTVYEQYVASTLHIPVCFVMPEDATELLNLEMVSHPDTGINHVAWAVSRIDSERARAWTKEDEDYVKDLIRKTVGFQHVDEHVTEVMVRWISDAVKHLLIHQIRLCKTGEPPRKVSAGSVSL